MLPTHILAWADKYHINHTIMWEIIETVTDAGDNLNEIQDETHLFNLTFEWACVMIESTAEDRTDAQYQAFILFYLPVVYALARYLMPDQHDRLISMCHGYPMLRQGVRLMLNRDEQSPTDPEVLR